MINELQAVAIATRFLIGEEPDANFREVWAARDGGRWLISFGKVFPPNVCECPGGWYVSVNAKTGKPKWFLAL